MDRVLLASKGVSRTNLLCKHQDLMTVAAADRNVSNRYGQVERTVWIAPSPVVTGTG